MLTEAGSRLTGMGYIGPSLSSWRSWLAIAHAALNRSEQGIELARQDAAAAAGAESIRCLGIAQVAAALCLAPGKRSETLTAAVATTRDSPARPELSLALIELGCELRHVGDRVAARRVLAEAAEVARTCGAGALEDRARAEAVAAGARPRRRALSGVDALTPSELRVAALVADGGTNRDVAEALFLSEKTVEGHLRGVFRKLEIASRTEIASRLTAADDRETGADPV